MKQPPGNFNALQLRALQRLTSEGYQESDFMRLYPDGFAAARDTIDSCSQVEALEQVISIFRGYLDRGQG